MILCFVEVATSQPFFFGNKSPRTSSAAMLGVSAIDFQFNGEEAPPRPLNYSSGAYGVSYSRSNIYAALLLGRQNSSDSNSVDLALVDFSLALWGDLFFSEAATSATHRVFVPIMLFSNYRKVTPSGADILGEFNITTLGLGLGLGYYGAFGENVRAEFRSTPALGYSVQSFGDAAGLTRALDNDIQIHIGSVFNEKIGISFGYSLRWMVWNINVSGAFATLTDDVYDYRDLKHSFNLGLNWK